jgi:hypothetical protein
VIATIVEALFSDPIGNHKGGNILRFTAYKYLFQCRANTLNFSG